MVALLKTESGILLIKGFISEGMNCPAVSGKKDIHLTVGSAGMMLQVVLPGFLGKMEITFRFRSGKIIPEFIQDLIDRPDLCQSHEPIRPPLGLFSHAVNIVLQKIIQQFDMRFFFFLKGKYSNLLKFFQHFFVFFKLLQSFFRLLQFLVQEFFLFDQRRFDLVHASLLLFGQ